MPLRVSPMTDDARTVRLRRPIFEAMAAWAGAWYVTQRMKAAGVEEPDVDRSPIDIALDAYTAEMRREGARAEHDAMCFTCKPQLPGGCWIRCARGLALSEAERGEAT